jgi:hypothetical protein
MRRVAGLGRAAIAVDPTVATEHKPKVVARTIRGDAAKNAKTGSAPPDRTGAKATPARSNMARAAAKLKRTSAIRRAQSPLPLANAAPEAEPEWTAAELPDEPRAPLAFPRAVAALAGVLGVAVAAVIAMSLISATSSFSPHGGRVSLAQTVAPSGTTAAQNSDHGPAASGMQPPVASDDRGSVPCSVCTVPAGAEPSPTAGRQPGSSTKGTAGSTAPRGSTGPAPSSAPGHTGWTGHSTPNTPSPSSPPAPSTSDVPSPSDSDTNTPSDPDTSSSSDSPSVLPLPSVIPLPLP